MLNEQTGNRRLCPVCAARYINAASEKCWSCKYKEGGYKTRKANKPLIAAEAALKQDERDL